MAKTHFHAEGEVSFKSLIFVPQKSIYNNDAARYTENLKVKIIMDRISGLLATCLEHDFYPYFFKTMFGRIIKWSEICI
jgi:hypothetical protein